MIINIGSKDKSIIIYYVNDNFNQIKKIQDHTHYVSSIGFSNDNKYLVSGSYDQSIIIYDVNDNFNQIKKIQDHTHYVYSVGFSNDNKYLVSRKS